MTGFEVNGVTITALEIRAEAASLRQRLAEAGNEVAAGGSISLREQAERDLIERVLLMQETSRLSLSVTAEEVDSVLARLAPSAGKVAGCRAAADTPDMRAEVSRRIAIDKLFERWASTVRRPSANRIRAAYRETRDDFWMPESVFVKQIIRNVDVEEDREPARAVLLQVQEKLQAGEDFERLAREWSECPEDGGTIGFVARGRMVPEFEDTVFALEVNRPSPVFETRFGFHIALVTSRRAAGIPSFGEVAPWIEENLLRQDTDEEIRVRMTALFDAATIRRVRA
jgi:parvulin-like peptidyl-prolyl isomerase